MRAWPQLVLVLALGLANGCQAAAHPARPVVHPVPLPARVTGAVVRPVGDERRGYGSRTARETLGRLRALGANTVGLLMIGRLRSVEDTAVRLPDPEDRSRVEDGLRDAGALGLATVLIPQLELDDGAWRGEIAAPDGERAAGWWAAYGRFIEVAADTAAAGGASALAIGVELKGLSAAPEAAAAMRALALQVRRRFGGVVTYDANWDEAEGVGFWDAVDLTGVNGYYPLLPDAERGAASIARRLERLAAQAGRPVLVVEVGFRSGPAAHVEPWTWPDRLPPVVDEDEQARDWSAVLDRWLDAKGVRGLMAWVVPTDPDDPASEPRHGFNPLNKRAESVLRKAFQRAGPPL